MNRDVVVLVCLLVAAPALASTSGVAAVDLVSLTRAHFPERPWVPLSAADAALAGSGRATDVSSSWSRNPALLAQSLAPGARLSGLTLDPQRSDLRAHTISFSDTSPFASFGESGIALRHLPYTVAAYLAQDAFDKERTAYIDTAFGQPPTERENEVETQRLRFGVGAAYAASERWGVGAGIEAHRLVEHVSSTPSEEAQTTFGIVPADVRVSGIGFGGSAGIRYAAAEKIAVGADARVGSSPKWKDESGEKVGSDQVPFSSDLGVIVGGARGGNLLVGASYDAAREAALGDSSGHATDRDPARVSLAAGYAYRPAEAPWEFRAGLGWSPRPSDGGSRFTRYGVGIGYDLEGILARASYAREARRGPDGEDSSRNFLVLSVEIRL